MNMKKLFTHLLVILSILAFKVTADETNIKIAASKGFLHGTLLTTSTKGKAPLAIIISGSGPTDRNGNSPGMTNNSLKLLATELSKSGISTLRYDKRGIGESLSSGIKEDKLRFSHYINDLNAWIDEFINDERFSEITLIGHSEGSLIAMVNANKVSKYISISGVARSADIIIEEQLATQPVIVREMSSKILQKLRSKQIEPNIDQVLFTLFRPVIQPYLISWFAYKPIDEIKKVKVPTLIIQGGNDIQVLESEASLLKKANPDSKLIIIKDMNHILKIVSGSAEDNFKTYNSPNIPVSEQLVNDIIHFIK